MAIGNQRSYSLGGRRWIGFGVLAVLAALLLGSFLYDQSRGDLIAPGVTVAEIRVGGLHAPAARTRLRAELRAVRARVIAVSYRGMRFTLRASQTGLTANVDAAVSAAVRSSRGGWFVGRTLSGLFGDGLDLQIAMPMTYSHRSVQGFVNGVERAIDHPARDASVSVGGSGRLLTVPSASGTTVEAAALRDQIERALQAPASPNPISAPVHRLKPRTTTAMLASQHPAYIVIDRPAFTLRMYQRLRLTHTYSIAVGMAGLETPPGCTTSLTSRSTRLGTCLIRRGREAWPAASSRQALRIRWSRGGWRSMTKATVSTAPTSHPRLAQPPRMAAYACSSQTSSSSTASLRWARPCTCSELAQSAPSVVPG